MNASIFESTLASKFAPHAFCLSWNKELVGLMALSDGLIALSYYSIPFALGYFAYRRSDLQYRWLLGLFAAFILGCGTSHLLDVWTLWYPDYRVQVVIKFVTAALSMLTAVLLWRVIPDALTVVGPAQLALVNEKLCREAEQRKTALHRLQSEAAERERAQRELQVNAARLQAILDTAVEGIIMVTDHGRVAATNPAAGRMFGYPGNRLLQMDVIVLMPQLELTIYDQRDRADSLENLGHLYETEAIRSDGKQFPVELAIGRFVIAGEGFHVAVVRDISQRRAAEAALKESERRLELALLGADLGTWDWNMQTGAVVFSERWVTMLGYRPHEIRPSYEQWKELVHPEDWPAVLGTLESHVAGQLPFYEVEHRLKMRSGEWLWVLARGQVLERDDAGLPLRAAGTHMDISARKLLEQRIAQQSEQLAYAQRLSTAGEIAAVLAHELNQPLAAIANYLAGAKLRFGPALNENPGLEQVINATLRLSDRAADAVASIRNRVRTRESRQEWVRVDPLISEALQWISEDLRQRKVGLRVSVPRDLPPVWGQVSALKQLFLNLMLNALDAMLAVPAGRRILHVLAHETAMGTVNIEISDTGPGIPEDVRGRLFKPFFSTKQDRMGLGLAICRSIVESHGGQIAEVSRPGTGARFQVILPIGPEEPVDAP